MKRGPHARMDKSLKESRKDVYRGVGKISGPSVCPGCGAVFMGGRWSWKEPPREAAKHTCPACRRIADNFPAGSLEISGPFSREHREEIISLVRNEGEGEKNRRPLERIMAVEELKDRTLVTFTGVHIARRVGESLKRAYQGELWFTYGEAENSIRIAWSR